MLSVSDRYRNESNSLFNMVVVALQHLTGLRSFFAMGHVDPSITWKRTGEQENPVEETEKERDEEGEKQRN